MKTRLMSSSDKRSVSEELSEAYVFFDMQDTNNFIIKKENSHRNKTQ